jgi:hypothetical protein
LATRRRESSDLSSLSCACSSALFFPLSSCTLIRAAIHHHTTAAASDPQPDKEDNSKDRGD